MSHKSKKSSFSYLSMCSCCNVVSKYSVNVKKHLQQQHSGEKWRKGKKLVIPVRISSRYEKCIHRSLDKASSRKKWLKKQLKESLSTENNVEIASKNTDGDNFLPELKELILCNVCKGYYLNFEEYSNHLSEEDHNHVKMTFKCPMCSKVYQNFKGLLKHFEGFHPDVTCTSSPLDCVNISICPKNGSALDESHAYCPHCHVFLSQTELASHIVDLHMEHAFMIETKKETGLDNQSVETIGIKYKCPNCENLFQSAADLVSHVTENHVVGRQSGQNSRKRKVPTWLQDENITLERKKKKKIDVIMSQGCSDVKDADSLINISSEKQNSLGKPASLNSDGQDEANLNVKLISSKEKKMAEKPTVSIIKELLNKQPPTLSVIQELLNQQPVVKPTLSTEKNKSFNNNAHGVCTPVKVMLTRLPVESIPERDREILKKKAAKNDMSIKSVCERVEKLIENVNELHTKSVLSSQIKLEVNFDETGFDIMDLNDSDDDYIPEADETDQDNETELDKLNRFECPNCDKTYTECDSLKRHLREKHTTVRNDVKETVSKSPRTVGNDDEEGNKVTKYKCPFCPFYLYHREYIISHIQQSHSEVKNFTAHDIVKEQVVIDKEVDREFFRSQKCSREETGRKHMYNHTASCFGDGYKYLKLPCPFPQSYLTKGLLTAYWVCPICNDVKKNKDELEKHIKDLHLQEKECNVQLISSLPEPRPMDKKCTDHVCYICPCCHFCTPRKDNLRDHIRTHKSNAGIKLPQIKCTLLYEESDMTSNSERSNIMIRTKDDGCISHVKSETLVTLADVEKLPDDRSTNNGVVNTYTTTESRLKEGTYICSLCEQFSTNVKETIVEHMLNQHYDKAQDYDINYILPDLVFREDLSNESNGTVVCKTCNESHRSLYTMVKHMLSASGHKGYSGIKTILAPRSLSERADEHVNWDTHVQPEELYEVLHKSGSGVEEISGGYMCAECEGGLTYATRESLMNHIETKHKDKLLQDIYACVYQVRDVVTGGAEQIFVCKVCKETVTAERKLVEHFRVNHVEKLSQLVEAMQNMKSQFECEVCHKQLENKENLHRHLLLHINQWQPHCPCCGLSFDTQQYADHHAAVYHADECRICSVCNEIFVNNEAYLMHMQKHVIEDNSKTDSARCLCQYCGKSILKNSYKRHVFRFHWQISTCDCEICTNQKAPFGKIRIRCDICDVIVCSKYAFDAHCLKLHPETYRRNLKLCQNCRRPLNGLEVDQMCMCKPEDKLNKISTNNAFAEKHNQSHPTEIYKTSDIVEDCSTEGIRKNVMKIDESSPSPYICSLCGFATGQVRYLYRHVRRKHMRDEEKKFRCQVCQIAFCDKAELRVHLKVHLKTRSYQCTICKNKFFNTKGHLTEHMYTHESNLQYACGYCDRKFAQNGHLYSHAICHDKQKPFRCMFCDVGYSTSTELIRHMKRYTTDSSKTQLQCTYCKERLPNMYYLNNHILLHFPQNPFKCAVCEKSFPSFNVLYSHKAKKKHFTTAEREQGKKDIETPGRRSKRFATEKSSRHTYQSETNEAMASLTNSSSKEQQLEDVSVDLSETQLHEVPSVMKKEIDNDAGNVNTMEGQTLSEDHSMLEINPTDLNLTEINPTANESVATNGDFEIEQDDREVKPDFEHVEIPAPNRLNNSENVGYTASILSENESGEPQTVQLPDGSLVHVFSKRNYKIISRRSNLN